MGHMHKCYVISTVTYYALTIELYLLETFVFILLVKVVSEMQFILWFEYKPYNLTPSSTNL